MAGSAEIPARLHMNFKVAGDIRVEGIHFPLGAREDLNRLSDLYP